LSRDKDAVARELLAMRCRRGDRTALEELIRTWERPLLYFIRRLVHDEADAWDVLQKTWVKVLSGISSPPISTERNSVTIVSIAGRSRILKDKG